MHELSCGIRYERIVNLLNTIPYAMLLHSNTISNRTLGILYDP